jgi:HTH-type transcriptional regulator / antitoxin HigA
MITNERQYSTTRVSLRAFRDALEDIRGRSEQEDPILHQAHIESLESEIAALSEQLEKYEAIRTGRVPGLDVSFDDLGEALALARVAAGLTQNQLAERVGVGAQQIQRYEAREYEPASYARLKEIVSALGVEVRLHLSMPDRKSPALVEQ